MKNAKKLLCMLSAAAMLSGCTANGDYVQTITCLAEPETTFSEATMPAETTADSTESAAITENTTQSAAEVHEVESIMDTSRLE